MANQLFVLFVLGLLTPFFGCSQSRNESDLIYVDQEDETMNAAMATAKENFGFFEKNWQTMPGGNCSLKFGLPTPSGELEHIWFTPTKIEGKTITGTCANEPVDLPDLSLGDTKTVDRSAVSDWMILVGNECYGGYTIKVLSEQQPDAAPPFEFVDLPIE